MTVKISFRAGKSGVTKEESSSAPFVDNGFLKGKNGASVLLIHGLTGTPNEMRYLANSLNRKGYSVFCPRLANNGEPMPVLKKTTWQDFYSSAREAFISMQTRNGKGPIFISGLCMGALLGLLLAEEFPNQVAGVSCLSVTLFYDGWSVPWYRFLLPLFMRTPLREISYYKEDPPYGVKDEAVRERIHRYYRQADLDDMKKVAEYGYPFVPATLFYQNDLLIKHVIKKLPSIQAPVQLIQAREDDTTSVKNSQFVYDRIGSKTKDLVLLEDSYHLVTVDRERDKVAEKLDEFFSRLRTSSADPTGPGGGSH